MPRNIHAQFGRRTVLRALPATIMSAFVPAWVLDGSLKLPKLVTGSRTTDPNFRAKRINPNVAVGGVEAVNAQRLIVRNAEGLHVVIMNGRTAIDKVLGDPAHLRLIDHDLGRVHVGDTVWVRGVRDTGGELSAQYIIVNWILGWAGIAVDYGHANGRTWMSVRNQVGGWMGRSPESYESEVNSILVDPSCHFHMLNGSSLKYVPATVEDTVRGQYLAYQAMRADDKSLVITDVVLGWRMPPPGYSE